MGWCLIICPLSYSSAQSDDFGLDFSVEAEKKIEQILDAWFEEHAQEERLLLVKRLYPKITLEK